MSINSVAIIGAGMAGITCASKLMLSVPEVKVFEKLGRAGGRMASVQFGEYQCDIGAQYFTAGSEAFADHLQAWEDDWLIDRWNGWLVELQDGKAMTRDDEVIRYIGRPGMDSVVHHLASLCDVQYNTGIDQLLRENNQWLLEDESGDRYGPFDAVVCATPAPIARRLLAASPRMAAQVAQVNMQPSWIVMLGFDQSLNMGFDAANLIGSDITWMANNASKPGREGQEVWLLQAGNEWSNDNQDLHPEEVIRIMTEAFNVATGNSILKPTLAQSFLWEHSLAVNPLGEGALFHERLQLGACGDWCQFARVEGAFKSGEAMADKILELTEDAFGGYV